MYLVLAVTILVVFNVLLAALLSRANLGNDLGRVTSRG